jgi:hypothetical protein
MTHRVDLSPAFQAALQRSDAIQKKLLDDLIQAFKHYVSKGAHPDFGRDAALDWPSSVQLAGLQHVHIVELAVQGDLRLFAAWQKRRPHDRTSNRMLVYVEDNQGDYCLLAYFHDDAHRQLNKSTLMGVLADMAEAWFQKNKTSPKA